MFQGHCGVFWSKRQIDSGVRRRQADDRQRGLAVRLFCGVTRASEAHRAMVSEPINGSEFPYELFGRKHGC